MTATATTNTLERLDREHETILTSFSPRVRQASPDLDIIRFEDHDPEEQDRQLGFA